MNGPRRGCRLQDTAQLRTHERYSRWGDLLRSLSRVGAGLTAPGPAVNPKHMLRLVPLLLPVFLGACTTASTVGGGIGSQTHEQPDGSVVGASEGDAAVGIVSGEDGAASTSVASSDGPASTDVVVSDGAAAPPTQAVPADGGDGETKLVAPDGAVMISVTSEAHSVLPEAGTSAPSGVADAGDAIVSMLRAKLNGVATDFPRDLSFYNGRAPMMDVYGSAIDDATGWGVLRVAVTPKDVLVAGEYECGPGQPSFITLSGNLGYFDTTTVATTCRIVVESAGNQSGELFAGRFEATVYRTDGTGSIEVSGGRFVGIVP